MAVLKALLLFLCLVLGTYAQTPTQTTILDDYIVPSDTLLIHVGVTTTTLPFQIFNTVTSSTILGGERDLILNAITGKNGLIFNTGVQDGDWSLSTPTGGTATTSVQYDGVDGSDQLATTGLGGFDLTTSASDRFKFTAQTDLGTVITLTVHDMVGGVSSINVTLPADPNVDHDYYPTFASFSGNADFSNAGSVDFLISGGDNVDVAIKLFALAGVPQNPSASPSAPPPPPNPSASPVFETWYRFDDDDDGKSPCGEEAPENTVFLADNNIIYYYFYGLQRPYIYISNPNNNSASLLIPSIFACIFAFFLF